MDDFEPSGYQEAIGNAVHDTNDSLEVNALAGTGKTSTIEWVMRNRLPDSLANETVLLQAFNKRIAEEAQSRMPDHVLASTMHSGGLKAVTAAFGRVRVDTRGQKVKRLIRDLAWGRLRDDELKPLMYPLANLIGKGKDAGVGRLEPNDAITWQRLIDHYDLDIPAHLAEQAIILAHDVLEANNQNTREADFGDMIYWPILFDLPVPSFPFVGVDEAQDLNDVQRAMLPKLVRPGGRLMAVGDPRQCQPPETPVNMTGGGTKRIVDIAIGDQVVSFDRHAAAFVGRSNQGRTVTNVDHHWYQGDMLTISVDGRQTRCTPDHKWLVRWKRQGHAVYLMRRGSQYRIGSCSLFYRGGFGPGYRARSEGADAVWVLSVHETKQEALMEEHLLAARFGLPMLMRRTFGPPAAETQPRLDRMYALLGPNGPRADRCLRAHGQSLEHPIWCPGMVMSSRGKYSFLTHASNLLPNAMLVPVYDGQRKARWCAIDDVTRREYNGTVVCLEVDTHGLYVADGILTHNSIYAWRGATPESMTLIRQLFGATQLPLNLNYRCSKSVIAHAQLIVPEIEARPWAPAGSVEVVDRLKLVDFLPTDAVLCRTNAPLIRLAYRFLAAGIGCIVLGREIGRGLIAMIDRLCEGHDDMGLDHLSRLVCDWISAEEQQARIRDREDKAQMARDKGESLLAAIESIPADRRTIPQLREHIESLFSDKGNGLTTLSTVHKAKGLEWERVFILDPHRMPSPWARQEWQLVEETNVRYVAITRAKTDLRYIESEDIA